MGVEWVDEEDCVAADERQGLHAEVAVVWGAPGVELWAPQGIELVEIDLCDARHCCGGFEGWLLWLLLCRGGVWRGESGVFV